VVGHEGEILWDETKPDGTPRKVMDVSGLARLGWSPKVGLREGIKRTYRWYLAHPDGRRGGVERGDGYS